MGKPNTVKKQRRGQLTRPSPLKEGHLVSRFDCGQPNLSEWIRKRAKKAQNDTARTFVVCRGTKTVVAYYTLAAGAVAHAEAPSPLRRNAPDPVPVIILARLAVDKSEAGQGIGKSLLSEACKKAIQAAKIIGARALIVHAINEEAVPFYKSIGFQRLSPGSKTLFIPIKTIAISIG
jgi:GNAT superfamily N-acetyltransferase